MNLAWIVSETGEPQARNLHAKDRAGLLREGYSRYRIHCIVDGRHAREADLYAQRLPSMAEVTRAIQHLFGRADAASVRLVDLAGKVVLS